MLNFLKKKKPTTSKTPSDFKKGEVYKMAVASDSHVKSPYYVVINDVGKNFIVTDIPYKHTVKIKYPSYEWDYHIPRMTLAGNWEEDRKLLYNQNNLIPE